MRTIHCSGSPKGNSYNPSYPRRNQSSNATFHNHVGPPTHNKSPKPNTSGNPSSPSHQHIEYRTISNQWQVPRTPLHHFPDDAQTAIINNLGRKSTQQSSSPAPHQRQTNPSSALVKSLDLIIDVLNYETHKHYSNFLGKSGDRFAPWMTQHLLRASNDILQTPASHRYNENLLLRQQISYKLSSLSSHFTSYQHLISDSTQRRGIVEHTLAVVQQIIDDLASIEQQEASTPVDGLHPSRNQRYGTMQPAPSPTSQAAVAVTTAVPPLNEASMHRRSAGMMPSQSMIMTENATGYEDKDQVAEEAHHEDTALDAVQSNPRQGNTTARSEPEQAVQHSPNLDALASGHGSSGTNGGRMRKPSTVAFRESFQQAALLAAAQRASNAPTIDDLSQGEQRTSEWKALRERRLTASAFSKALGFFEGDRVSLWEEKVGLKAPFAGNQATNWGTRSEPFALEAYQKLTGRVVEGCMFKVKHDDAPHGWLGASPDGLVCGWTARYDNDNRVTGAMKSTAPSAPIRNNDGPSSVSNKGSKYREKSVMFEGPGIVEIKCPFNKGHPELAIPPRHAIWYYMPQLQGLMDIFDREWCNLYVWTQNNGSSAFYIPRDREYWGAAFDVLAEFWWVHVVPARQAYDSGASLEEVMSYRPDEVHAASAELKVWSKRLAEEAHGDRFPAV